MENYKIIEDYIKKIEELSERDMIPEDKINGIINSICSLILELYKKSYIKPDKEYLLSKGSLRDPGFGKERVDIFIAVKDGEIKLIKKNMFGMDEYNLIENFANEFNFCKEFKDYLLNFVNSEVDDVRDMELLLDVLRFIKDVLKNGYIRREKKVNSIINVVLETLKEND